MDITNVIVSGLVTVIMALIGYLQMRAKLKVEQIEEIAADLKRSVAHLQDELIETKKRLNDCEKDRQELHIAVEVAKRIATVTQRAVIETANDQSALQRKLDDAALEPLTKRTRPNETEPK